MHSEAWVLTLMAWGDRVDLFALYIFYQQILTLTSFTLTIIRKSCKAYASTFARHLESKTKDLLMVPAIKAYEMFRCAQHDISKNLRILASRSLQDDSRYVLINIKIHS